MDATPEQIHAEDERRIVQLEKLGLIRCFPREPFDALAALAARTTGQPIAMVTLIDRDQVLFKASYGADPIAAERQRTICDLTIRSDAVLQIADTLTDSRLADRGVEIAEAGIRSYAGLALHGPDRTRLGTICVGGPQAKDFTSDQIDALCAVAAIAESMIASLAAVDEAVALARRLGDEAQRFSANDRILRQTERLTQMGAWRYDPESGLTDWSEGVYRIHELDSKQRPSLEEALDFYPPHARAVVSEAVARTIETGASFDIEVDFVTARGRHRRVRSMGELEVANGRAVAVTGVFQDVTERYHLEQSLRELASIDELTRIANRATFNRTLEAEMERAKTTGSPLTLLLIDLDAFKAVNDTWGHLAGDDVLRAVGRRLRHNRFGGSVAARLGGDEFALIVTDRALCADIDSVIEEVSTELARPVRSGGALIDVSGTVGVAEYGPDTATVRDFLHRADTALYDSKRARPARLRVPAGSKATERRSLRR